MTGHCTHAAPPGYSATLCASPRSHAWCVHPCVNVSRSPTHARQTATGGSATKAVEVILEHGVPEDRIIFINPVRVLPILLFPMTNGAERRRPRLRVRNR